MKTESGTDAFIPLGDLLTTEDPVWIWDAAANRILWANYPAREFWGVKSLEALQSKRFSSRSRIAARLSTLAAESGGRREWTEDLPLPSPSGLKRIRCHMQELEVAGGRTGFIIKALQQEADRPARPQRQPAQPAAAGKSQGSPSAQDALALRAIADRLQKSDGPRSKAGRTPVSPSRPQTALEDEAEIFEMAVRELSHELGNPLNVIRGFAAWIGEIAPRGRKQDKLRAYAGNIMESADLALAILQSFSARYSGPDAGERQVGHSDIGLVAERCIQLVAPLAKDSGVRLRRRIEGGLPGLLIEPSHLKQILMNLLINAIRYHKTGSRVRIDARRLKSGEIRLSVADDGKGMTRKEIKAALSSRAASGQAKNGRTGLGLPLVKRLVEKAGAVLAIESRRGKGTKILVTFPPEAQTAGKG